MNALSVQKKRLLVGSVCLLAIVASAAWIFHSLRAPAGPEIKPHLALGQALADETAKLLGGQGRIVVITLDPRHHDGIKAETESFLKSLRHHKGITVAATETVSPYELDQKDPQKGMAADPFLRALQTHGDAQAIVSFVGVPRLQSEDIAKLDKSLPKFLAVSKQRKEVAKLFDRGLLHLAIVPRYQFPSPVAGKPKNSREWFDKYFQIVTTARQLSPPISG